MKDSCYWFKHDLNSRTDPKLIAFRRKYRGDALSLFWCVIELLHEIDQNHIPEKQYMFETISEQSGISLELVKEMIAYAVDELDLLKKDASGYYSDRVMRNVDNRNDLSVKRSIAGKSGGKPKSKNIETKAIDLQSLSIDKQTKAIDLQSSSIDKQTLAIRRDERRKDQIIKDQTIKEREENSLTFSDFLIENKILNPEASEFINSEMWFQTKAMQLGTDTESLSELANSFLIDIRDRDMIDGKNLTDFRAHFISWYKQKRTQALKTPKSNHYIPDPHRSTGPIWTPDPNRL
jgi:hypothetical protein